MTTVDSRSVIDGSCNSPPTVLSPSCIVYTRSSSHPHLHLTRYTLVALVHHFLLSSSHHLSLPMASPVTAILVEDASLSSLPSIPASTTIYYDSVWEHFEKGDEFHHCTFNKCGAPIKAQSDASTSNMHAHLQAIHRLKRRPKSNPVRRPAAAVSSVLNYFTSSSVPPSSSPSFIRPPPTRQQKRQWTVELLRMVVEMNVPFRALTESVVMREFIRRELQWEMPSRDTLRRLIPPLYNQLVANLRERLRGVESISITTDSTFLTLHQVPYICITGHWIDSSWELQHTVLAVFMADQGESGTFIAGRLRKVLEGQLGLSEKVHCVVTDEGQNFLSAVTILKQMDVLRESLRCACHRIQLSVKRAMTHSECKDLMTLLNKCQTITLQFKNGWMSRKRDILRKYQEMHLKEMREEVERLRREIGEHRTRERGKVLEEREKAVQFAEQLRDMDDSQIRAQQRKRAAINEEVSELTAADVGDDSSDSDDESDSNELKLDDDGYFDIDAAVVDQKTLKDVIDHICRKKALVQKAATRWMTYVAVVERTLMWRTALTRAMDEISADSSFRKKKVDPSEVDLSALRISEEEAKVLEEFQKIGQSCRTVLESLEGDDYPSIGSLLHHHSRLFKYLVRAATAESLDPRMRRFCQLAAENCSVKFTAEVDRPALIGAVLDPRYRQLKFLSSSEAGKCKDALNGAFTVLQLEESDDAVAVNEPVLKRRKRAGKEEKEEFNFDIDGDSPCKPASQTELDRYLALPNEPETSKALDWWKAHAVSYPLLSQLARRYLAIPASSASSERTFSKLKLTATAARHNLRPDKLCMLLFIQAHHNDKIE